MSRDKSEDFRKQLERSAEAKKEALKKFRAAPGPDDPAVAKLQAARQGLHTARELRHAQRAVDKQTREAERVAEASREAERAAQAVREGAETAARVAAEDAQRKIALETERKSARDARYAARKKRKR
jgi:hypothetical protein